MTEMGNSDIKFTAKLEVIDGKELIFPAGRGVITHVCCDCGATHLVEVIPHKLDKGFTLRFFKDNRATGQRRRIHTLKQIAQKGYFEK